MPVAHQERVHISTIPGRLLRIQLRRYRCSVSFTTLSGLSLPSGSDAQRKQQDQRHQRH
jgi:hypothetical protein